MRSLLLFPVLALALVACVEVHNPPPRVEQQQPASTVVVPPVLGSTTTIICPAGAASC